MFCEARVARHYSGPVAMVARHIRQCIQGGSIPLGSTILTYILKKLKLLLIGECV